MIMNSRMKTVYAAAMKSIARDHLSLDYRLSSILEDGFLLAEGGVFLRRMYERKGNAQRMMFPDRTGYECFVNHLHIDDYVRTEGEDVTNICLVNAISFVKELIERFRNSYKDMKIRVIVSADSGGCTVRFHRVREGKSWVSRDLESYQAEGIMVLDS